MVIYKEKGVIYSVPQAAFYRYSDTEQQTNIEQDKTNTSVNGLFLTGGCTTGKKAVLNLAHSKRTTNLVCKYESGFHYKQLTPLAEGLFQTDSNAYRSQREGLDCAMFHMLTFFIR